MVNSLRKMDLKPITNRQLGVMVVRHRAQGVLYMGFGTQGRTVRQVSMSNERTPMVIN